MTGKPMRYALIPMLALVAPALATSLLIDIRKDNPTLACGDLGPDTFYFPRDTFRSPEDEDGRGDELFRNWFSPHLASMGEPSFTCGAVIEGDSIRFLWLRSFDQPVMIRVSHQDGAYLLTAIVMNGMGGYPDTKDVAQRIDRAVSEDDWRALAANLALIRFQDMPSTALGGGADGSEWIIETSMQGEHHVAARWMGGHGLRQIGLLLLTLSGLSIPPDDIY